VLLLAIDTSTPAVTAALHDGSRVLAESTVVDARRHGEQLVPRVQEVLRAAGRTPADVTVVAVGVGPGPFTGLRVGVVTALTLGAALGVPVHGVCSLDAWSWGAASLGLREPFAVVTDARRKEVYWAAYAAPGQREDGPGVGRPADVAAELAGRPVIGPATDVYDFPGAVPGTGGRSAPPTAALLADLAAARLAGRPGCGEGLLPPRPLYLRRPDATPPGERKRVLA
jgi:tRNA threonylcarbamoyl adenosine modification protein YeaZ